MAYDERRWTSRDGLRLYARDYPAASGSVRLPVVCLHGLTRNSADFEEVAPAIAASGRRVLVPDVRGRGLSDHDPRPERYVPMTYARDVLELIDALGIARAIFVGTSMGGLVAMAVAGLRSRAIAAAVLNDIGPAVAPEGIARIMAYAGKAQPAETWSAAATTAQAANAVAFPTYTADDWRAFAMRTYREDSSGRPVAACDPAIATSLAAKTGGAARLAAWLLFRRLARRRPVLLLRGTLSDIITRAIVHRMQRHAPRLVVVEVPGVGHAPMLTEPVAHDALDAFLHAQL